MKLEVTVSPCTTNITLFIFNNKKSDNTLLIDNKRSAQNACTKDLQR